MESAGRSHNFHIANQKYDSHDDWILFHVCTEQWELVEVLRMCSCAETGNDKYPGSTWWEG